MTGWTGEDWAIFAPVGGILLALFLLWVGRWAALRIARDDRIDADEHATHHDMRRG